MKRGLDTNVLVYAHIPGFKEHEAARGFLREQLADPGVTLVITPLVLHELVHVITDARRFDPPVAMSEALAVARLYLDRTNIECASIDREAIRKALWLLEQYNLGRKRIADTLFVAALDLAGASEIITCNPKDFAVFEQIQPLNPLPR